LLLTWSSAILFGVRDDHDEWRNKRPAGATSFAPDRVVLLVHGATYPVETGFDLPVPGGSWLEYMASRAFDAYLVRKQLGRVCLSCLGLAALV